MAESVDFRVFSVLVTGSNQGIGLGLVKRFLELPSPPQWVFATTLDLEGEQNKELRELVCKYPNLVVLQLDVTKLESIQAALNEVQKCVGEDGLTILINNAGTWAFNDLQTENAKDMMRVYSVDVIGTLQMSQAFLPLLKKAARRNPCQGLSTSKAAIINISSNGGSIELVAYWDQYKIIGYRCAKVPNVSLPKLGNIIRTEDKQAQRAPRTLHDAFAAEVFAPLQMVFPDFELVKRTYVKAALNMLTKCQSLEYPANGIMSIAIHPGSVKTADNPNPEISVEESTQGIMTVLSKLCEEDNVTFVDWLGRPIPW